MDLTFWACGLLAVVIAVTLSSVELLSKYQTRSLPEIFSTRYYFAFVGLNALFCFIVYLALPALGGLAIKSDLVTSLENPLARAVTAGLGYLLIARTSILDIKTKGGETLGLGFDGIYNVLAQYLLRHHGFSMEDRIRESLQQVYTGSPLDPMAFLAAATDLGREQKPIADQIDLALRGNPPRSVLCETLYRISLECARHDSIRHLIEAKRSEITRDAELAEYWRRRLPWLNPHPELPPVQPPGGLAPGGPPPS